MMMLPPVLISLPFKLLMFVLVDGWALVVGSLLETFVQDGMGPRDSAQVAAQAAALPLLMIPIGVRACGRCKPGRKPMRIEPPLLLGSSVGSACRGYGRGHGRRG